MQFVKVTLLVVIGWFMQPITTAFGGQETTQISTIDFVQIVNKNEEEALFYYQNNWLKLRKQAKEQDFIQSFELLDLRQDKLPSFDLMLVTTYQNQAQFEQREGNFQKLIELAGKARLKNHKKPSEFRKVIMSSGAAHHLQ